MASVQPSNAIILFSEALNPANQMNLVKRIKMMTTATQFYEIEPLADSFISAMHGTLENAALALMKNPDATKSGPRSAAFGMAYKAVCTAWFRMFRASTKPLKVLSLAQAAWRIQGGTYNQSKKTYGPVTMSLHHAVARSWNSTWRFAAKTMFPNDPVLAASCPSDSTVMYVRPENAVDCHVYQTTFEDKLPCHVLLPQGLGTLTGQDLVVPNAPTASLKGGRRRSRTKSSSRRRSVKKSLARRRSAKRSRSHRCS
jgi:hypothetical protein